MNGIRVVGSKVGVIGVAVALLAVLSLTCIGSTSASRQDGDALIAEAEDDLDRLHARISLPRVVTPNVEPSPRAIRVSLAPDGIYVDVVGYLESAPSPVVEKYLEVLRTAHFEFSFVQKVRTLADFGLEPLEGSSFFPEPLWDALSTRTSLALHRMKRPGDGFSLVIHADRRAPYGLVRHVLKVARDLWKYRGPRRNDPSPFGAVWPIVEVDGRPAALRAAPLLRAVSAHHEPEVCAGPFAYVREDGVALLAQAYTLDGRPVEQERRSHITDPRYPEWDDQLVVDGDGRCPSVPSIDGTHDLARLGTLARRIGELGPGCGTARVGADDGIGWNDVAQVAATLLDDARFEQIHLEHRRLRFPGDCRGLVLP